MKRKTDSNGSNWLWCSCKPGTTVYVTNDVLTQLQELRESLKKRSLADVIVELIQAYKDHLTLKAKYNALEDALTQHYYHKTKEKCRHT